MGVEREPVTHLTAEQAKLAAEQKQLQELQSSLQQLASAASEFALPSLFENIAVGDLERTDARQRRHHRRRRRRRLRGRSHAARQLGAANLHVHKPRGERNAHDRRPRIHAQGGREREGTGERDQRQRAARRSTRRCSKTGRSCSPTAHRQHRRRIHQSHDPAERSPKSRHRRKEGKNAEYHVDGVAGSSSSNTVTNAIAGVTLTFGGLTPTGPVTIDVQPPAPASARSKRRCRRSSKLYNSTVESIQSQLTDEAAETDERDELGAGTLFGDIELTACSTTCARRCTNRSPGSTAEMSSPLDVGLSTGAPTGGGATSQASLEGLLTLEPAKLAEAIKANPAGVRADARAVVAEPAGHRQRRRPAPAARSNRGSAATQRRSPSWARRSPTMNEMLAHREKALQATYAQLEGVISRDTTQSAWLTSQEESSHERALDARRLNFPAPAR